MTDDDDRDDTSNDDSGGGARGGGGGGGGAGLLGLLFFAVRHPKITLVLVVIGGLFYLFGGGGSHFGDEPRTPSVSKPSKDEQTSDQLGTGATLDPKVYDEALVHEATVEDAMPSRVSLREYAPPRRSQGHQGSCVGWATSYAARSILKAREDGQRPAATVFSPSFVYNQVGRPDCNGTYVVRALELMQKTGDLPLDEFPYDQDSCSHRPDREEKAEASRNRIAGFARLSLDGDDYRTNTLAVKQHLVQQAPVVIGMQVGGTFEEMRGKEVWHPTRDDYALRGSWGGHAMAVIGYDDTLEGGAFEVMNSWGPAFGRDGIFFVKYRDFDHFVKEAYGLYPMGAPKPGDEALHLRLGLLESATKKHLPMSAQGDRTFRTARPIKVGTRFKVEVSTTQPIYMYLFGEETDGTSYVLFPYTPKHSAYCGTTGTRVFPRKQSLTADDKGTRDSIAVVVSSKELDFKALNEHITQATGASYGEKLKAAVGRDLDTKLNARVDGEVVVLDVEAAALARRQVQAMVLEFDKR